MPLNAREAMRGSPSPWNVFAIMPKQARVRDRRLAVSVKERAAETDIVWGRLGRDWRFWEESDEAPIKER